MSQPQTAHVNYTMITLDSVRSQRVNPMISVPAVVETTETDDEIRDRINNVFGIMRNLTKAIKKGMVRGMIVTGPPGIGKSHEIRAVLSRHDMVADVADNSKLKKYEIVDGVISAPILFSKLYEFSDPNCIVVFDDCDDAFMDPDCLNIIKGALDSSRQRVISYNKDSRILRDAGVPNSFVFNGGVIFITNVDFNNVRSKKLEPHLKALESRCHFLDLKLPTDREKLVHVRDVIDNKGMLDRYNLSDEEIKEIYEFMSDNRHRIREISPRMADKLAGLRSCMGDAWTNVAAETCMRK